MGAVRDLRAALVRAPTHAMNTRWLSDGSLLVQERWRGLRVACVLGAALVPLVIVPAQLSNDAMSWRWFAGTLLGSAGLLLAAAVLDDRRFRFDAALRQLTWEQRNWLRSRGGTVSFDDIMDVKVIELGRRDGDDAFAARSEYAAVLQTTVETMQLSATRSIHRADCERICDAVLSALTRGRAKFPPVDPIERLITGGRMIEAVAFIRSQCGVGLMEARQMAQKIRDGL